MPSVDVAALTGARKLLGFSRRKIEMSEGETIADLLRSLETVEGGNLHSLLVCEGKLRGEYAIVVNGLSLSPDSLDRPLQDGEQVVMMEILRHLAGG